MSKNLWVKQENSSLRSSYLPCCIGKEFLAARKVLCILYCKKERYILRGNYRGSLAGVKDWVLIRKDITHNKKGSNCEMNYSLRDR